jgi:integrase
MAKRTSPRRNPATAGLTKTDIHEWPTIRRILLPSGKEVFRLDTRIGAVGERKRFATLEEARAEANKARATRREQGESAFGSAEMKAEGVTPAAAMKFYLEHLRKRRAGVPLLEALAEWGRIKTAAGEAGAKHLSATRTAVTALERAFPGRLTSEFETADVDNHLSQLELAGQTKKNRRRCLHAFFNWCVKSRKYAAENPVTHAADYTENLGPSGTLTPDEAAALLTAEPAIRPWLVLQMFCGLRASEADRLDWSDINLARKLVSVPRQKAKGDLVHARKPSIPANALAWLSLDARDEGRVRPPSCRDLFDVARWKCGWKPYDKKPHGKLARVIAKASGEEKKMRRRPWSDNIARHTCLSAHYALHGNLTASWGGTSDKMLGKHYNEVMARDEAEAWFKILPTPPANVSFGPWTKAAS